MFYAIGSSSMDQSNRMTGLEGYAPRRCSAKTCGMGNGGTQTAASVPRGGIRRREIRGQERQQGEPAKNEHKRHPKHDSGQRNGIPCPYCHKGFSGGAEGRKALKTAPKCDTKTAIRPFPLLRQKWTDFITGGTMPRMSRKRKNELAFFLNDRGRVTYNELCRKCRHTCKQSFRATVIDCPRYLSKRAKNKEDTH